MAHRLRALGQPVVLLGLLVVAAYLFSPRPRDPIARGTRLVQRTLATTDGRQPLWGEGVTVLNFWGETCPPCRAEAPDLTAVHRSGAGRVLGVSVDSRDLAAAGSVARSIGIGFPVAVLDEDLVKTFHVTLVPTTVLIDARGVVRRTFVGAIDEGTLRRAIRRL